MRHQRFEVGKQLADRLVPSLPSASYVAVVYYCWLHGTAHKSATSSSGLPLTVFAESISQIARGSKLSPRRTKEIVADLERAGVFETEWTGRGVYPSRRIIRHTIYLPPSVGCERES
jgi:hypothetical protein